MDVFAPISTLMSSNLTVLTPEEPLAKAKELFEKENIHHIPVVEFKRIIGLLSKSDLLRFLRGNLNSRGDEILEETRLRSWQVKDIMHEGVFTMQKEETILQALDIFKNNQIHCIPILEDDVLVGIVTPYDILMQVRKEGMEKVDKIVLK